MAANLKFLRYIGYSQRYFDARSDSWTSSPNNKAVTQAKEAIKYVEANRDHHRNNPHLFNSKHDHLDRRPFMRRIEEQPQIGAALFKWKLGVTEQERDELKLDYQEWTREFMARVEAKYRQKLDWVAGIHDDKGHPHIHILIRGKDFDGNHVNFYGYDISKLNKLAEETKRNQAIRNLGPKRAEKVMERLERIAAARQAEKERLGIPRGESLQGREPSLGGDILKGLATEIQKMINQADWEREQAERQARRELERKAKQKKKNRGMGR